MSLYVDYLEEIQSRAGQGLAPKPKGISEMQQHAALREANMNALAPLLTQI